MIRESITEFQQASILEKIVLFIWYVIAAAFVGMMIWAAYGILIIICMIITGDRSAIQ